MKKNPSQESIAIAKLIESKPEIDQKVEHYKSLLKNSVDIIDGAKQLIELGETTEWASFLGIKITKTKILNSYDIAKLNKEIIDADTQMWYQQQYYEQWLNRLKDFDAKFEEVEKECEANWDVTYAKGEELRKMNPMLEGQLRQIGNFENDKTKKVQVYLLIKQHIFNSENFKK
jgi:hypothetical protein